MKSSAWNKATVRSLLVLAPALYIFVASDLTTRGRIDHLVQIGTMHEMRAGHTSTVLQNGVVLIAGGFKKGSDGQSQVYSRTAELFDPKARSFTSTTDMNMGRASHTATLLTDGWVLIAGGFTDKGMMESAEVYDPSTKSFIPIGQMSNPRGDFTATRLENGDVLLAGGGDQTATASAELFHAGTNRFSVTGAMLVPRRSHTATLLPTGKILIAGGASNHTVYASTELYDPGTGVFAAAGTMNEPRCKHAAVLLKDGHTLILGGSDNRDWRGKYRSAEIYDSRSDKFTPIPDMVSERFKFPASVVQLRTGSILLCGGSRTVEIFNFFTKRFEPTAQLDQPYYYGTASCLNNHSILIVGGYTDKPQSTDKAWLYVE